MRWGLWRLGLPFALAVTLLVVLPLLLTALLALSRYDGLRPPVFVGLAQLRAVWADPLFHAGVESSLVHVLAAVPLRLLLASALALALSRPARGARLARALAFAPSAVPDVALALVWLWLVNPLHGPLTAALAATGLVPPGWALTAGGARASLVLFSLLQVGEVFAVVLAARRELPPELYEACDAEGATPLYVLRRVTLPLLAPVLALLAARDVAWTLHASFVPALVVTRGGPLYATHVLPLYAYQSGFEYLRFGQAAALSLAMLALTSAVAALLLLAFRLARRPLR